MQDKTTILASSVNSIQNISVFDRMVQARLASIDLSAMCMYLIDVCPVEALPVLAKQFDMLGFNGWVLCDTEDQRRSLIKRAIELKKYRGTPWSVKEALRSVGFRDVQIQEGASGALYDAEFIYDGTITHGGGNWASFRINLLDLGEEKGFSSTQLDLIKEVVNKYKAARCKLLDVVLVVSVSDYFDETEDEFIINANLRDSDEFNVNHTYNGEGVHDGSWTYSGEREDFDISINETAVEDSFNPDDSNFYINVLSSGISIITEGGEDIITESGNNLII
jgi:phage tail P2-like protein